MNLAIRTVNFKYTLPIDIIVAGFKREGYRCKKCGHVLFCYDVPGWRAMPRLQKYRISSKWISEHYLYSQRCFTVRLRMWNQGDSENARAIMEKRA